jgi:hypothetical protein
LIGNPAATQWDARSKRVCIAIIVAAIILSAVLYGHKAAGNASAILRWRDLIQSVVRGENVYNEWTKEGSFPYPPIAGMLLWPITQLPAIYSALFWFCLKLAMAAAAIAWSIQLVRQRHERFLPTQVILLLILTSRPILSDLQHGNINILILFVCMAGLIAFRNRRDWLAGTLIGLAAAIKVTPLLFVPYFAIKRQWNIVGASLCSFLALLFLVPSLVIGFGQNLWLVRSWSGAMIEPYVLEGKVETLQTNQSLPGVTLRLLTDSPGIDLPDGSLGRVNWFSVSPQAALGCVKAIMFGLLVWIGWLSRRPASDRTDPRLAMECAMVFIAMLLVSERSWKHHFVTMTLPYAVLVASACPGYCSERMRVLARTTIVAAFLLMASTSSELTGWLAGGAGHKYAQAYGMFCASGAMVLVALFALHWQKAPSPSLMNRLGSQTVRAECH